MRSEVYRHLKKFSLFQQDYETATTLGYNLAGHINLVLTQLYFLRQEQDQSRFEENRQRYLSDFSQSLKGLINLPQNITIVSWEFVLEDLLQQLNGCRNFVIPSEFCQNNIAPVFYFKPYARVECRRVQLLLKYYGIKRTIQKLRVFERVYPHSAHPLTHIGELYLWSGKYETALDYFQRALKKKGYTSWANVGFVAANLFLNNTEVAIKHQEIYQREFPPAPTLYIYLAEYYWRQNDQQQFDRYLLLAYTLRPKRLSIWIFLLLRDIRLRRKNNIYNFVLQLAPQLFHFCQEQLVLAQKIVSVEELMSQALMCMRGNRSSVLVTYWRDSRMCFENIQWPLAMPIYEF